VGVCVAIAPWEGSSAIPDLLDDDLACDLGGASKTSASQFIDNCGFAGPRPAGHDE
jgi:hypothetical protein